MIELVTPDGEHLRSRPLGISYFDGTNSVMIAELTNSVGQIMPSGNQVIYTNAFTDFAADYLVENHQGGFECSVVFRQQPPPPAAFGMPDNSRLELLTEFFNPPAPGELPEPFSVRSGLQDRTLVFGAMRMVRGKAFMVAPGGTIDRSSEIHVFKSWVHLPDTQNPNILRTFLLEEVPYNQIESQLQQLHASATPVQRTASADSLLDKVSAHRLLPVLRLARSSSSPIQTASLDLNHEAGLVMDYTTVNGTQTNYTFAGDGTYYVDGQFTVVSNVTFEGGTVLKFDPVTYSSVYVNGGSITCLTGPYHPAVFTSKNDNSLGETISGSSGSPSIESQNYDLYLDSVSGASLHDLRFCYCYVGVNPQYGSLDLANVQFVHTDYPFYVVTTSSCSLRNALMYDVRGNGIEIYYATVAAEQLTVDQCYQFGANDYNATLNVTNSLLVSVTNWGMAFTSVANATNSSSAGVFQTVAGGSHYLADDSPYRNAGMTNIDAATLTDLTARTTYPPTAYTNTTFTTAMTLGPQAQRDTDVPDLGYHYDPIDWIFGGCTANSNVTVVAGTAVGWFRTSSGWGPYGYGLHMADDTTAAFNGTEGAPDYWVRCNTVQEQDLTAGYGPGGLQSWCGYQTSGTLSDAVQVNGRFVKCCQMGNDATHFQ